MMDVLHRLSMIGRGLHWKGSLDDSSSHILDQWGMIVSMRTSVMIVNPLSTLRLITIQRVIVMVGIHYFNRSLLLLLLWLLRIICTALALMKDWLMSLLILKSSKWHCRKVFLRNGAIFIQLSRTELLEIMMHWQVSWANRLAGVMKIFHPQLVPLPTMVHFLRKLRVGGILIEVDVLELTNILLLLVIIEWEMMIATCSIIRIIGRVGIVIVVIQMSLVIFGHRKIIVKSMHDATSLQMMRVEVCLGVVLVWIMLLNQVWGHYRWDNGFHLSAWISTIWTFKHRIEPHLCRVIRYHHGVKWMMMITK
jgi:hypothetical protein